MFGLDLHPIGKNSQSNIYFLTLMDEINYLVFLGSEAAS
jgi:hypothetical protein